MMRVEIETRAGDGALAPPSTNGAGPPPVSVPVEPELPNDGSGGSGGGNSGGAPMVVAAAGYRRPPVRKYPSEMVESVRARFTGTITSIRDIAREVGISASTVTKWADLYGWQRADDAPKRSADVAPDGGASLRLRLKARLYKTFGRQLATLEKRAYEPAGDTVEKDARTLGILARTLETLNQLDRDDGAKVKQPETVDRGHLRLELARRIAAWAEEGEESAQADRPDA